uniref:Uncharacterized protein n=1 Tax=Kalanchoe fedtschenkoi TaxID=63787 RepID=A0A7N0V7P7_KALFE
MDRIELVKDMPFRVGFTGHAGHMSIQPLSPTETTPTRLKSLPDFVSFVLNFLTHHHPHNPRRRPSSDASFTHHHLGPLAHLPPTPPSPLRPPTPSPPPASSTPPSWSICGSGGAATRVLPVHLHHPRPQRRRLHSRFVDSAVQSPASSQSISTTRVLNVAASIADLWIRRCSHQRPPAPAPSPPPARPPAPCPPPTRSSFRRDRIYSTSAPQGLSLHLPQPLLGCLVYGVGHLIRPLMDLEERLELGLLR